MTIYTSNRQNHHDLLKGFDHESTSLLDQITQILKQFPTVKEVIISVDGGTEDAIHL